MYYTFLLSMLAGLATLLGAVISCSIRPSQRVLALFLGLAAGIMAGVVVLDLVPFSWKIGGPSITFWGLIYGVAFIFLMDRFLNYFMKPMIIQKERHAFLRTGYLIALGISLHDLPEGIAIAAGFSAASDVGWLVVAAIALHNIPEGMATAVPLRMGGLSLAKVVMLSLMVSFFTPLGTGLGFLILKEVREPVAFLLAFAAGAMAYLVRFELIPGSRRAHSRRALWGMAIGFLVMAVVTCYLE